QPNLIITVDCGTGSVEAVEAAIKAGVDVVVTDHHEPSDSIAPACAVVNPKLGSNPESYDLAGVAVAFKVCHALLKAGREKGVECVQHIDIRNWMDILAIGIIADIVPMTGENRTLARYGLFLINSGKASVGVKALMEVAGINDTVGTYHVGFLIGPRLNAGGRMGKADVAAELLLTEDAVKAAELAIRLDSANKERKRIENGVRSDAEADIDLYFNKDECFGVVTGQKDWHPGTIGIVASRLCSRYARPAVVISFDDDGMGKGSCRSIQNMDIIDVLGECSDYLESFGGHKMAAGLVIKESSFEQFKEHFNKICRARLKDMDLRAKQNVDVWMGLGQIDKDFFSWLQKLEPFGPGNTLPVIGTRNVRILGKPRVVGNNHLKMTITCGNSQFDTIGFGLGNRKIPDGPMDMLFNLQENTYRGRTTLQLNIKDFAASIAT
ncbi:MAG: single-stranded-DNA-specific exonuclease RecJ, partial [Kiritimatiellae bacterium]|nr:single-stranded-DNA-specific exonuclease RecJ [Kiritimatiellia bacterium]